LKHAVEPPGRAQAPVSPQWAARFPEALAEDCGTLAVLSPDAEQAVARTLKQDFPDPTELRRERDSLRSRLAGEPAPASLAKRISNIESRLAQTPAVSKQRLDNLHRKLGRLLRRTVLDVLQARVDGEFYSLAREALWVDDPPRWLLEHENRLLLYSILQLRSGFRDLGLRLLRSRCGSAPWDLLEEPANRNFLDRLRQRGISVEPWIATGRRQEHTTAAGQPVMLALEDDPVEVLHMGRHFGTCLSPAACNFFSAVANAVDVNKRVLYARDARGAVVGRCLLALSREGGLLTFHPYAHDRGLSFDHLVAQFAEPLAAEMGTVVIPRGGVESLVAPEWYDDGPRDLCERFAFLQRESAFRESLRHIPVADFRPALESMFDPLPLNDLTLPLILDLSEFDDRPELIVPLLPAIAAAGQLSVESVLRAAMLAHRAGADDFARRNLKAHACDYLIRQWRRHGQFDETLVGSLADIEPAAALRVMRQTREKHVRSDEEENWHPRRRLLATIYDRLGRPTLAARLRA
jgi:hypothetical protein